MVRLVVISKLEGFFKKKIRLRQTLNQFVKKNFELDLKLEGLPFPLKALNLDLIIPTKSKIDNTSLKVSVEFEPRPDYSNKIQD